MTQSLREALSRLVSELSDAVDYTGGDQAPDIRTSDLLPLLIEAKEALAAPADERDALREAAIKARAALSELLATRDPVVYSDALKALDEALARY